jgi:hypothetical protein
MLLANQLANPVRPRERYNATVLDQLTHKVAKVRIQRRSSVSSELTRTDLILCGGIVVHFLKPTKF